jgi:hypothetical protein
VPIRHIYQNDDNQLEQNLFFSNLLKRAKRRDSK